MSQEVKNNNPPNFSHKTLEEKRETGGQYYNQSVKDFGTEKIQSIDKLPRTENGSVTPLMHGIRSQQQPLTSSLASPGQI